MQVVLFGTGAMACLFGARLSTVSDVTLVGTWSEAMDAIRKRGILCEDSGEVRSYPVRVQSYDEAARPADLVIVAVKSWQTARVASRLAAYIAREGVAFSLQNGLGNVEILGPRVFPGATGEGATLLGPGHVRSGGSGQTFVVAPGRTVRLLRRAGFDAIGCSTEDAEGLLWGKLCASCGINALTALLQVPNGELLGLPGACDLMVRAAEECAAVAEAKGVRLPFPDAAARAMEVAQSTAGNWSSMYQDIERGAPTECDAIYGSVVRAAQQRAVGTPVNRILWTLMRALVERNRRLRH